MKPGVPLDEELFQLAIDYLDGELDEGEEIRFELRLANDPELAEGFERIAALDELQRQVLREEALAKHSNATFSLPGGPWAWRSAAALLLVALGASLWFLRGPDLTYGVVALPSGRAAESVAASLGLDPGPFREPERGAAEGPHDADANARRMAQGEDEFCEQQLLDRQRSGAAESRALRADYFRVGFRSRVECSALVFALDQESRLELLSPASGDEPSRFEADVLHYLPSRGLSANEAGDQEEPHWAGGFERPPGVDRLTVLIAIREEPLTLTWLDDLRARLVPWRDAPERLRRWLEEEGFVLSDLEVTR